MLIKSWRGERWFHAHETRRMDEVDGLPLASFKSRMFAIWIDFLIIGIAKSLLAGSLFGLVALLFHPHQWKPPESMKDVLEHVETITEAFVYFGVLLKLGKGRTPGKRLMKIRVVSLTHHEIGWWQSIERGLGYGASWLEGGFGFFQYWMNRNRMCVHDRIAETIVVDERKPRQAPALEQDPSDSPGENPV